MGILNAALTAFQIRGRDYRGYGAIVYTTCALVLPHFPRLFHYFISKYSDPSDRVLDPYSEKGTTVLEACPMGRKGIGNDIWSVSHGSGET